MARRNMVMPSTGLQGLIDEVLRMARDRRDAESSDRFYEPERRRERQKREDELAARDQGFGLERIDRDYTGKRSVEEVKNTGARDVANINETGAMARQRLVNEGNLGVANVNLEGHKYTADTNLRGSIYSADKGFEGQTVRARGAGYAAEVGAKGRTDAAEIASNADQRMKILEAFAGGNNLNKEGLESFATLRNTLFPAVEKAPAAGNVAAQTEPIKKRAGVLDLFGALKETLAPKPSAPDFRGFDRPQAQAAQPRQSSASAATPPVTPRREIERLPGYSPGSWNALPDEEKRRKRKEVFYGK
jgi:hypothetical protein